MAAGLFRYGTEVLRLDDEYSADHHFGLRMNLPLAEAAMIARRAAIEDAMAEGYPSNIGPDTLPKSHSQILATAEADIMHVIS